MNQPLCFIGPGNSSHLQELLDNLSAEKVLLVTGHESFALSGAQPIVEKALKNRQYHHLRQGSGFIELEAINECLKDVRSFQPDSVLAVGGGTVLDAGKLLAILGCTSHSAPDLVNLDLSQCKSLPLIAVPTTAGTGSEATSFAAAYIGGRKMSIAGPCMLPHGAIVDADLMTTLSPYITAYTGIDALSQAVESYWSRKSTEASRKYASEAITLAYKYLPYAVLEGDNQARIAMAQAAHLSGKAINITGTTAPHAFSYGFTFDCGIPHGHAVALTLPTFFRYNAEIKDARIQEICKLLNVANAEQASVVLHYLIRRIGLKTNLAELGIGFDKLAVVASKVDPVRLNNNPRQIDPSQILPLLQDLFREQSNV